MKVLKTLRTAVTDDNRRLLQVMLAALALCGLAALYPSVPCDAAVQVPQERRLVDIFDEVDAHRPLFPLELKDYIGFACAIVGLVISAGGGIGGGGILVPVYILILKFPGAYRQMNRSLILAWIWFSLFFCPVVLRNSETRHPSGVGYGLGRGDCQQLAECVQVAPGPKGKIMYRLDPNPAARAYDQ